MTAAELERLRTDPALAAARAAGINAAAARPSQGLPATITIRIAA